MTGFEFPGIPPVILLWPVILTLGVYVLLRWVVVAPGGRSTAETISQHALWIGVMGWMGSSLQGAATAGVIRSPSTSTSVNYPTTATPADILTALAWPLVAVLIIHTVGQFTYPQPKRARRSAPLAVRRITDFLPKRLAWTTVGIFVATAIVVCWVASLPGYEAVPPSPPPPPPPPGATSGPLPYYDSMGRDGRIAGFILAACLGGALLVLAGGTCAVLALIARRRQLETLDAKDNDLLRTIAMNRLLRTVATVAGGLLAIAGNFAGLPDPSTPRPSSWVNYLGIANMAILLVMFAWRPPRLTLLVESRPDRPLATSREASQPATKLIISVGAVMPLLGVGLALLSLMFARGTIFAEKPSILVGIMASAVLLTIGAGEILLQRNYGQAGIGKELPHQPVSPALFTVAITGAAIFLSILAISIWGDFKAGGVWLGPQFGWIAAAATVGAVLALAALPLALIVRRRNCGGHVAGLDAALRGISFYRLTRTIAAFFLAQAGVLLSSESHAFRWLFGLADPLAPSSAYRQWDPGMLIGAILCAVAVVLVVIPVRSFVPGARPVPDADPVYR